MKSTYPFHSGKRLALLRKLSGFTQESLIGEEGFPYVSLKTLRRWEKMGVNPLRLEEVVRFFKMDLWSFIDTTITEENFRLLSTNPTRLIDGDPIGEGSQASIKNKKATYEIARDLENQKKKPLPEELSLLLTSIHANQPLEIKKIIQKGVNLNYLFENDWTPLIWAANDGKIEICELLLAEGAHSHIQEKDGFTALILAAGKGNLKLVQRLVKQKEDVNIVDKSGWSALTWAASFGYFEILELLIAQGALVDVQDNNGLTPLMRTARDGQKNCFDLLLKHTSNPYLKNKEGYSTLQLCLEHSQIEFFESLLGKMSPHTLCSHEIDQILQAAIEKNDFKTQYLIETFLHNKCNSSE